MIVIYITIYLITYQLIINILIITFDYLLCICICTCVCVSQVDAGQHMRVAIRNLVGGIFLSTMQISKANSGWQA